MSEVIITDGCTGFPDQAFGLDFTSCCTVHDAGGSDGTLLDCLSELQADNWGWSVLILFCLLVMKIFQPFYNFCQDRGWLPKTRGSK